MSQALGLGKSNVHRMLATLVAAGYVRATGGGRYEATLRMWEYGTHVLMRNDVKRVAGPLLQRLVKATGETAHLSVLDGREVVYVDKIDGDHPVRAYSRIGARAPAHAVATGKALLAGQSASFIESYAAELPPEGRPEPLGPHPTLPGVSEVRRRFWASYFPERTIIAEVGSTITLRVHNTLGETHALRIDNVVDTGPIIPW